MPAELKMCEFAAGETYDWNDAAGHDPTQTVGTYNLIFIIITFIFLFLILMKASLRKKAHFIQF